MAGYKNPFDKSNYGAFKPFDFGGSGGPAGTEMNLPPGFFNFDQPNLDKFSEHLGGIPQREDHRSGAIDKILSALIGGATGFATENPAQGYNVAMEHLDRPYNRALQDWNIEAQSLGQLAGHDLETNQNKANILKAIQDGDLAQLKLLVEQQRNQGQIERWQGQTGAEFGRLGLEERGLELEEDQLGLEREKAGDLSDLYGSRGNYYDAMADKAGRDVDLPFDPVRALEMNDYILDPTVFRAMAPQDIQRHFELNPESGRMDLIPPGGRGFLGWGSPSPEDQQGYEKARQWYLEVTGRME